MERMNWAVLGLIGIVTALGLGTSSGAGKTKTDEQSVAVSAASDKPSCSACCNHASATQAVAATKPASDEACAGNCAATGVCCDKSLLKLDAALVAKPETHVCEGECISGKSVSGKAWVIDGTGTCKPVSGDVASADCPLTKAADAITNLTKQYVCEGGECLTKPGHGTLTIKAVDPATVKPEGLSNLLAAAEAVHQEAKPEIGPGEIVTGGFAINAKPTLNFTTGTLTVTGTAETTKADSGTLTINALPNTKGIAIVTTQPEAKPAIDNSRAAARAAKLAKLEEKMAQPWTLALNETPLTQAAAAVQEKYGVPVLLDRRALQEMAFDTETPLTADQQPEIEAGEFLRGYLRNHDLTWMIPASNDRILITSIQAMEAMPINRVYDVTDLIDDNHGAEGIVERIQSLVEPQSWKANGGQGDLTIWQKGNRVSLICSNTYWAQRAIAELLEDLRSVQETEEKQAPGKTDDKVSVMRRYDLPGTAHLEDAADQQKQIQHQRDFLLALCKDIEGFDPTMFQVAVYGTEMLVTKQTPAVHRKLQQTLKLVTPSYPCAGGFGGGATGGAIGN